MKKKIGFAITAGVLLIIVFFAGVMFEVIRKDPDPKVVMKQVITVKKLAFDIEKLRWFFLDIDDDWQLGFEWKYMRDSKGRGVKAWTIKKYKRAVSLKKEVADISIAGAGDNTLQSGAMGK